jgi:lactoylglutathione lyase
MYTFNHFNFNVFDLERSLKFYDEALGLKPVREKNAADGSFRIVFLEDGVTDFRLELTWLRDRTEPYDLGEQEYHLAFKAEDYLYGEIAHDARGSNGFGYDPLFLIPELGRRTAEISAEEKNRISHRGKALRQLVQKLEAL